MELKDTVKLMLSADKAGTLPFKPTFDYELLYEQLVYMKARLGILEKRADMDLKRG